MQSSKLPIEVCERIIDFLCYLPPYIQVQNLSQLSEATRTICSCALVCRSWVPRSQHHLFHRVELRNSHNAHVFLDIITRSPGIRRGIQFLKIWPFRLLRFLVDSSHR